MSTRSARGGEIIHTLTSARVVLDHRGQRRWDRKCRGRPRGRMAGSCSTGYRLVSVDIREVGPLPAHSAIPPRKRTDWDGVVYAPCVETSTRDSNGGKGKKEETTNDRKARRQYRENERDWTCKGMTMNEKRCRKLDGKHPMEPSKFIAHLFVLPSGWWR